MAVNVEKIICCIKQGDQDNVLTQLDNYNTEAGQCLTTFAHCFFFDVEERDRRKQRELEEFRRNKVRDCVPDSDSGDEDGEDPELFLRR
ncbi:synembryn-A, partial [Tachysurus ichikawai]